MPDDERAASARQRELVRRGFDAISGLYRSDGGAPHPSSDEDTGRHREWAEELVRLLPPGARVVDLGCGAGVPATLALTGGGRAVLGVDFSAVQLGRARRLVPAGRFVRADMAELQLRPASVDAVMALYSLIHLPLADQRSLLARIRGWLRPGGYLLALVGAAWWTATEHYLGAEMFWDHADADTYLRWLRETGFEVVWDRFIPEGNTGHTLILASAG
jgi:SAM-dependent methyltransferase